MLAQQDLMEGNLGKSPVLAAIERLSGSPYKEAVLRGEIAPFPWDHTSPQSPSHTDKIQEFESSSGTGESSGDSTPVSVTTYEEYRPQEGDEHSQELFTPSQGSNVTSTTFETTPKSALTHVVMVDIPQRVPTQPKNFAPRSRRGPQACPASWGGCEAAAVSQDSQCTTPKNGQRAPSSSELGDSDMAPSGAGSLGGRFPAAAWG